jgi:hypothetical protein
MAAALREQNWTAIAVEFLVVAFGVFLGLQASNWNADLTDRRREAVVLQQIAEDLVQDRRELAAGRRIAMQRIAAANYVLEQATGEPLTALNVTNAFDSAPGFVSLAVPATPPLADSAREALWSAIVSAYHPSVALPAFDSLVSSGRLDILRDDALVREIQQYRLNAAYLAATQNETMRSASVGVRALGEAHGLSAFAPTDAVALVRQVAASPQLIATIRSQLGWAVIHVQRIDAIDQRAAALQARLPHADRS